MTINQLEKEINKLIGTEKAYILMQYVLKVDRKYLIINKDENLSENVTKNAIELAKKVQSGYPVQYITNKAYFMGIEFFVNEDVLIPQPDTEVVVMQVLNEIEKIMLDDNIFRIKEEAKLRKKYAQKYEGYELEQIIKRKLYEKGFRN